MAEDPQGRKPHGSVKPAGKQEVADPHQQIADACKGKDTGAGEIIDAMNESERNAKDGQQRNRGTQDDQTRRNCSGRQTGAGWRSRTGLETGATRTGTVRRTSFQPVLAVI